MQWKLIIHIIDDKSIFYFVFSKLWLLNERGYYAAEAMILSAAALLLYLTYAHLYTIYTTRLWTHVWGLFISHCCLCLFRSIWDGDAGRRWLCRKYIQITTAAAAAAAIRWLWWWWEIASVHTSIPIPILNSNSVEPNICLIFTRENVKRLG